MLINKVVYASLKNAYQGHLVEKIFFLPTDPLVKLSSRKREVNKEFQFKV
jgi:hypothetical protein